jgi:hypothetical protein
VRVDVAVKAWLLGQIEKQRAVPARDIKAMASDERDGTRAAITKGFMREREFIKTDARRESASTSGWALRRTSR